MDDIAVAGGFFVTSEQGGWYEWDHALVRDAVRHEVDPSDEQAWHEALSHTLRAQGLTLGVLRQSRVALLRHLSVGRTSRRTAFGLPGCFRRRKTRPRSEHSGVGRPVDFTALD